MFVRLVFFWWPVGGAASPVRLMLEPRVPPVCRNPGDLSDVSSTHAEQNTKQFNRHWATAKLFPSLQARQTHNNGKKRRKRVEDGLKAP